MISRLKHRMQQDEGFTLIELLIVIVVLGILAAIVVFALSNQTSNAAKSACNADAKSVEVAVEAYRAADPSGAYPTLLSQLTGGPQAYLRKAPPTNAALGAWDAAGVPTGALPAGTKYLVSLGNGGSPSNTGHVFVLTNGTGAVWTDYDNAATNPCDAVH